MKPNHFTVRVMEVQCNRPKLSHFGSGRHEVYPRSTYAISTTFSTKKHYHVSSGYSLPTLYCRTLFWQFMHFFHPFIAHFLIALCFITTDASLYPPVIIGNTDFREYKDQQYIEKKVGEILELNCSTMEAVKWILPDNTLHSDFDPVEVRFFVYTKGKKQQHSICLLQILIRLIPLRQT